MRESTGQLGDKRFRVGGVFKHDPLSIFRKSTTPVGLYARSRWIGLHNDPGWQKDFDRAVATLRRGQLRNGSWDDSPLLTISRLFGLHLTVRESDDRINKALNWISDMLNSLPDHEISHLFGKEISSATLESLPFVKSNAADLFRSALLFLATVFGRGGESAMTGRYADALSRFDYKQGRWSSMATTQNFFRAFIVHPDYSKSGAIQKVVDTLAGMQRRSGSWQCRINSYLTINALGHLDMECAESQIVSALRWLKHTQNRDGSWGRSGKEWKTFLIIHAIRKNSARVNTPHS
jgi:hypothetical protein